MRTLSVTEVARNFSQVLDEVERDQEEVVLVRDHRQVARLVPEPPGQTADVLLGDLRGVLDDETAQALSEALESSKKSQAGTMADLRDPWAS